MKKAVWIVIGVVVIGGVVFIGRQKAQNKVGHASGLSSVEQDALGLKERGTDGLSPRIGAECTKAVPRDAGKCGV